MPNAFFQDSCDAAVTFAFTCFPVFSKSSVSGPMRLHLVETGGGLKMDSSDISQVTGIAQFLSIHSVAKATFNLTHNGEKNILIIGMHDSVTWPRHHSLN